LVLGGRQKQGQENRAPKNKKQLRNGRATEKNNNSVMASQKGKPGSGRVNL
jgi:hypothetical protein